MTNQRILYLVKNNLTLFLIGFCINGCKAIKYTSHSPNTVHNYDLVIFKDSTYTTKKGYEIITKGKYEIINDTIIVLKCDSAYIFSKYEPEIIVRKVFDTLLIKTKLSKLEKRTFYFKKVNPIGSKQRYIFTGERIF